MEENVQVKNLAILIVGNTAKVYFFPTMEQANKFKANPRRPMPPGSMILVTRGDEGLRHVAGGFLVDLYNMVNQGGTKVKKFEKKEVAIRRVYAALVDVAEEMIMSQEGAKVPEEGKGKGKGKVKEAPAPKEKKERGPSYHDKIRAYFKDQDTATVAQIMEITGADERNAKVAMGIIQNSKRVKNPMSLDYHRATKTYYLLDDGFGRKGKTPVPPEPEPTPKKTAKEETAKDPATEGTEDQAQAAANN